MEIKTKFEVGETAYYLWDNRMHTSTIREIHLHVGVKGITREGYLLEDNNYLFWTHSLHKTKEDLLETL